MKIKKVQIFVNENKESLKTKNKLVKLIKASNLKLVEDGADLLIAIGGDGSFLRMLKSNHYDTNKYYVGINCGTLGFLQNINPNELNEFIEKILNEDYSIEEIALQKTIVKTRSSNFEFFALNEILIREKELNTLKATVNIDNNFLENYVGDGLLISTSVGSTAYNLSYGGSIVYNTLHTMQITPIAPLNSKAYRNIINSIIIPEKIKIDIKPIAKNILFTVDGENISLNDVMKIGVECNQEKIKCVRLGDYHFIKTINDKFLKD